jgi:hypothetical protein
MATPPSPPGPLHPTCATCSKPIRSGGFIRTAKGEVVHLRCRSEQLVLRGLDLRERGRLAIERAAEVVEKRRQRLVQPTKGLGTRDACPLCGEPAVRTDWRPHLDWTTIEECSCRGFFVWTPLLEEGRLARLTPEDRDTLKAHLRDLRATGLEAWLTTRDRTVMGALLIRTERPDRPR